MSDAGLSFETATRRTGRVRALGVAAEMALRVWVRFEERVEARRGSIFMVGSGEGGVAMLRLLGSSCGIQEWTLDWVFACLRR